MVVSLFGLATALLSGTILLLIFGVSELHLADLLQASFETEPLVTQRAPKKVAESPENMGQLTPQEKSLIAQYRAGSLEQRRQAEAALRPLKT